MCTCGNYSEVFSQFAGVLDERPQGNDAIPTTGRLAAGAAPTGTMKPAKLLARCRKSRDGPRAGPAGTSVRVKRTWPANAAAVLVSTDVARTSEDHRTVLGFQVVGHCEAEDPFASLCRAGAEIIVLQARHGHLESNNARPVAGCDPDLAPEDVKGVDLSRAEFARRAGGPLRAVADPLWQLRVRDGGCRRAAYRDRARRGRGGHLPETSPSREWHGPTSQFDLATRAAAPTTRR